MKNEALQIIKSDLFLVNIKRMVIFSSTLVISPVFAQGGMGMTWGKIAHNPVLGTDLVGCIGKPSPTNLSACEPYVGDTSCKDARPILCLKKDKSVRPNYAVRPWGGVMEDAYYQGWSGGQIATTQPIYGYKLSSRWVGDLYCKDAFGPGWNMAEFHDGRYVSGMQIDSYYGDAKAWKSPSVWPTPTKDNLRGAWSFHAYGNTDSLTRSWVRIDDQPANCWNP